MFDNPFFIIREVIIKMNTIVGLSTAISNSAINIIRLSGNSSLKIINKIFQTKDGLKNNEIKHGFIKYKGELFDEVMVSFMKSPRSYTGEDVIEINCHGGIVVTNRILNLLINLGAKMAEPGEFTKRAFLNGKIDLTKAESIIDLINAKSDFELKCALNQKNGNLYRRLTLIKEKLINILSNIEVMIDFEDEISESYKSSIEENISDIVANIQEILKYKDQGILIKNGIQTCIVGKPNVGKSSLLNYFCKDIKAIVTDIPGTTRDIVEETVNLGDIILNISDTAGIRKSDDVIENIGIEMAKSKINESNLILFVLDSTKDMEKEDLEIYELVKEKNIIFLLNKCDTVRKLHDEDVISKFNIFKDNLVNISVKNNIGFDKLEKLIKSKFMLNDIEFDTDSIIITNMRYIEILNKCLSSLNDAMYALKKDITLDVISIDIQRTLKYIMNITGEDVSETIINNIFSKFCIGK